MKNNYKEIIALVKKKNIISRTIIMLIGVMILALNYNIFLLNNNLVVGGTSGLAVILKALWNIPPAEFIFISGLILIIVSFIFIGKEQTGMTIVGAIIYPIFIKVTTPIATTIIPHVTFDSLFLSAIVGGLLFGLANGLIYKTGFSTGGSDVIIQILNKYLKIPTGKSVFFTYIVIICAGVFVFGINTMLYSIIVLIISSNIIDRILIGISDSKMFFIYTRKTKEIEKFIINELQSGVTIFDAEGGFSRNKKKMIMCVVPTRDYYLFKQKILEIDPQAFIIINSCYEVNGGVKRKTLPFL